MSQLDEALSSEPDRVVLHIGGTSHRAAKGHGVSDAAIDKIAKVLRKRNKRNVPFALVIYAVLPAQSLACGHRLGDAVIVAYQDDSHPER